MRLYEGDCRAVLSRLRARTVHVVVTDPPYFLDGLDAGWRKGTAGPRGTGAVGGLPVGMRFSPAQGGRLQAFLEPIAQQLWRVLKPGAFVLMFSAPRLAHRVAAALESSDFEIRDQFAWHYRRKSQFKAFKQDHFVKRRTDMLPSEKEEAIRRLDGRRTPQLRPQFESIVCAQKPREGTFVDNWLRHRTGLIDATQALDGRVPSTVMAIEKSTRERYNGHLTPKPVELCEHLIRVFSAPGQTVLDPFMGSGTTCIAAHKTGRRSIGIDVCHDYIQIARKRLEES